MFLGKHEHAGKNAVIFTEDVVITGWECEFGKDVKNFKNHDQSS